MRNVVKSGFVKTLGAGVVAGILTAAALAAPIKNGFDLAGALVPPEAIEGGGPPRDGIPAIDRPRFIPAERAGFLKDSGRVLGLSRANVARAYPIPILNWHEIVNDEINGEPIAVTYCPLCGTGVAYRAEVDGRPLTFGVSGLLYNSDVLLYDRETESLWSQILAQAVAGPLKGKRLEMIPLTHTSWSDWRRRHPDTLVLSTDTGHPRDYTRDPYAGYETSSAIWFKVAHQDGRYHPKELVIGVEVDGRFKAYPFAELVRGPREFRDTVGDRPVVVRFNPEHRTGAVYDSNGQPIPSIIAYWFAWYAFHPETDVFEAGKPAAQDR